MNKILAVIAAITLATLTPPVKADKVTPYSELPWEAG